MTDESTFSSQQPGGETIAELAERRLRQSPYFYLKRLRCRAEGSVLSITGSVPYRQLSQLAERIVSRVDGVSQIVNSVEVVHPVDRAYRRSSGA